MSVTFTPAAVAGALNTTAAAAGTLTVISNATNSTNTVALSGTAERSLVTHYYRSILRRTPDAGGKSFWESEAVRMQSIGVNVNETWYSMAGFFFTSAEYLAFNRDNNGFVTDLYNTFFNRPPDIGGLDYWTGQLGIRDAARGGAGLLDVHHRVRELPVKRSSATRRPGRKSTR